MPRVLRIGGSANFPPRPNALSGLPISTSHRRCFSSARRLLQAIHRVRIGSRSVRWKQSRLVHAGGLKIEIVPWPSMLAGGGTAMRWFTRGKRKDIWDEEIRAAKGDMQA